MLGFIIFTCLNLRLPRIGELEFTYLHCLFIITRYDSLRLSNIILVQQTLLKVDEDNHECVFHMFADKS